METLPQDVIGKICSFTDDETIHHVSCANKLLHQIINACKERILFYRNEESTYETNFLKDAVEEINAIPYDFHNFDKLNVIKPYLGENIECIEHRHHVSSPDNQKRYNTYYFNAELLANDILTSVKIKGDIHKITFEFGTSKSFYDNMTNSFWHILPCDSEGYKELLTDFLSYVYFRIFAFSEIILKIVHSGDIDIKTTFVNFDKHHRTIIENLTFRRQDEIFSYALIPSMLLSNHMINTKYDHVYFQVFPAFISTGFVIVIKTDDGMMIENPCQVVKNINIDIYSKTAPCIVHKSYLLNSRRLTPEKIKKNKLYNLEFDISKCLYIPLENVNFDNVSQTVMKVTFHKEHEFINSEIMIDVLYFGKNMILNKHGFGAKYYW